MKKAHAHSPRTEDEQRAQLVKSRLKALRTLATDVGGRLSAQIVALARLYCKTLARGGTLYFAGNGGSAADAQHVATEYVVRYNANRRALPAVAITTDTSLLTACANDLGFERVFARQVEALVGPDDLLVLHSTSGASTNIVVAARTAKAKGVTTVALLGQGGGEVRTLVDYALVVPSDDRSRIQEMHLAIQHIVCELVELELAL